VLHYGVPAVIQATLEKTAYFAGKQIRCWPTLYGGRARRWGRGVIGGFQKICHHLPEDIQTKLNSTDCFGRGAGLRATKLNALSMRHTETQSAQDRTYVSRLIDFQRIGRRGRVEGEC
jgi:hypothetical protein